MLKQPSWIIPWMSQALEVVPECNFGLFLCTRNVWALCQQANG
jgi:hypothetical protein